MNANRITTPPATEPSGIITPGCVLTVDCARAGLHADDDTWAALLHLGLRVRKIGNQQYVLSDDIIYFVANGMPKWRREELAKSRRATA